MTRVRAIRDRETIQEISTQLEKHHSLQYAQIWRFGINVGLRAGDILSISMDKAKRAIETGTLEIKAQKTGKIQTFSLNLAAQQVIKDRLYIHPDDEWLFQSHSNFSKRLSKPLSVRAVYDAFQEVGENIGVKMGTHTMRKTRARMMYEAGQPLAMIAEVLGHANLRVTRIYIDIMQEEVDKTYHDLVL